MTTPATPDLNSCDVDYYIKIRDACTYRSQTQPEPLRSHKCFHPGLPHMADCCLILCPRVSMHRAELREADSL